MTYSIKTILNNGDKFIDIGANEGFFSLIASRIVGSSGKVIAIEPQSRIQEVLIRNISENNALNIELHQIVISDKKGVATLHLSPLSIHGSTPIFKGWQKYSVSTEYVLMTTLSAFLSMVNISKIKLVKIDVESSEYEIILGSKDVFSTGLIENIALELHPDRLKKRGKSEKEIIDFLLSIGYKQNYAFKNLILSWGMEQ
ncbi:MAG: FkbM family methyltransferase [Candidatus Marinimicrobia bacterium]|nr:FkbM family methyltransferase [Candidatus Neomarinimicrobiota bacterium]